MEVGVVGGEEDGEIEGRRGRSETGNETKFQLQVQVADVNCKRKEPDVHLRPRSTGGWRLPAWRLAAGGRAPDKGCTDHQEASSTGLGLHKETSTTYTSPPLHHHFTPHLF
jgi:hypothetical protein